VSDPLFAHNWTLRTYGMLEDGTYGITYQQGSVEMIGEWVPTDDEIATWLQDDDEADS
jgi:hypothetical protein